MSSSYEHVTLLGDTRRRVVELLRRAPRTAAELAGTLGVTANAVRSHLTALERDELVRTVAKRRDGVGKPATVYGLTPRGEALFPKAYATVLHEILVTLGERLEAEEVADILRKTGHRMAATVPEGATPEVRIRTALDFLESLGALIERTDREDGVRLQGYACPLAAVVPDHPEICELVRHLIEGVTRADAHTRCRRDRDPPGCAFEVALAGSDG